MALKTFVFQQAKDASNTDSRLIYLTPDKLYDAKSGYGFVTDKNCEIEEMLQIPELNSGFIADSSADCAIKINADAEGIYAENGETMPLIFKADVNRLGNYEVTITLVGQGDVKIYAGFRNLVYETSLAKHEEETCIFTTNLTSLIPKDKTCMYENRSIDLAIWGGDCKLKKLSIKEVNYPTIYIAGDSYVAGQTTTYPLKKENQKAGWGQVLPVFLKKGVAVSNQTRDDLTVETFRQEGHFAMILAHMKLGDYLLLSFAKSDFSILENCIEEARAMGAYPIFVVSPLSKGDDVVEELQKYNLPIINLKKLCREHFLQGLTQTLSEEQAIEVAKLFVIDYLGQMEGQRPDAYTKLSRYFQI